jgi:hypothetical protein
VKAADLFSLFVIVSVLAPVPVLAGAGTGKWQKTLVPGKLLFYLSVYLFTGYLSVSSIQVESVTPSSSLFPN